MKHDDLGTHQVQSDGRTVWVNEATGGSVARLGSFGDQAMIDVHRPLAEQCAHGECLDCRHDLRGSEAWLYFLDSVKKHFGVTVAARHRPRWA